MSRLRQRSEDAPVTLLPFLAVLICTMGALIVLLVVVVQQARVQATEVLPISEPPAADAQLDSPPDSGLPDNGLAANDGAVDMPPLVPVGPTPAEVSRAQQERDKYLWEIQMLAESREKTRRRLREKSLALSHLEEHTRRVSAQLDQLKQDAQPTADGQTDQSVVAIHAELAQIGQQVATKKQQLKSARQLAASRRGTYQLVPYTGSRGTTRRPIYVECVDDAVIIQPEGVRFEADDFVLTRNIGNPLAAALRAVREYWLKTAGETQRGEPYPLLVVRPGGESAYAACRQALRSWDDEFGYELIASDVTLSYPPADAQLAAEIERAAQQSRRQQQQMKGLLAIHESGGPVYRASRRNGGFVRDGGSSKSTGNSSFSGQNSAESPSPIGAPAAAPQNSDGISNDSPDVGSPVGGNGTGNDRASSFQPTPSAGPPPAPSISSSASSSTSTSPQVTKSQSGNAGPASLAGTRGKDWALPNAASGAIPIRRPLYITVNKAQLVLEAERGTNELPQAIAFGHSPGDAVQSLVTLIWQRIDGWGVAGPGVYWKPTMEVAVMPDGETRFHALASLLKDSGIELQRR